MFHLNNYAMKTIATLIAFFGIPFLTFSQITNSNPNNCSIVYSEDMKAYYYADSASMKCEEILLQNLPPLSQSTTLLKLNFVTKGSYTLKKAQGLIVPDGYNVLIEDQLTGQNFDLKSQDSYSFSFNRIIPDRFIMHIKSNDKFASKNSN
jgi:hypothetical protein